MKKTFYAVIASVSILLIYVFAANYIDERINFGNGDNVEENGDVGFGLVEVSVGNSVGVTVERDRFYGKIVETHGKDYVDSDLYLFNLFKLPYMTNSFEWIYIHLTVVVVCAFIICFCLMIDILDKEVES